MNGMIFIPLVLKNNSLIAIMAATWITGLWRLLIWIKVTPPMSSPNPPKIYEYRIARKNRVIVTSRNRATY
jgi:hypothetical protein